MTPTCDDCGAKNLKEYTYTRESGVGTTRCEPCEAKATTPARHFLCLIDLCNAGEKCHPQAVILEHYPDATELESCPIADRWLFTAKCKASPPPFIHVSPHGA